MGTSASAADLARKLQRSADVIVNGNEERVKALVKLVRGMVDVEVVKGVGADHVFRNNRNRRIGTTATTLRTGPDAQVKVAARGPMSWLQYGIRPHEIVPGGRNKFARGVLGSALKGAAGPFLPASSLFQKGNYAASTKGAGVVLKFADGTYSRWARNSGSKKPTHAWSHGVEHAEQLAPTEAMKITVRQLGSVFA